MNRLILAALASAAIASGQEETAAMIYEAAFDFLDAPIARISGVEVPMPYAKGMEQAGYKQNPLEDGHSDCYAIFDLVEDDGAL